MKTVRRAALVLICGVCVGLSAALPASAIDNETFGVTPFPERANGIARTTFSIPLETGATFEDAVRVYNKTDDPLTLTVYATDANTKLDDSISVGLREERARGVGAWIDLARGSVELEPRAEVTVPFRVDVKSSDPEPRLGAIVIEKSGRGLAANAAQRLHVVVRTVPPNTGTTSKRVRSLVLRSPWVFVALFGLVVAAAVVWIGARRSRRPRDIVVPPGELDTATEDAQGASRPVIKRLGATDAAGSRAGVLERVRASAGAARRRDDRPFLDDALVVEIDPDAEGGDVEEATESEAGTATPAPERKQPASVRGDKRKSASVPRKEPAPSRKQPAKRPAKAKAARSAAAQLAAKPKGKTRAPSKPAKSKTRAATKKQADFIPLKEL